ncbi:MAG: winged helix-turn-helix domain-containing protein [Acidobacteriota bacterium]
MEKTDGNKNGVSANGHRLAFDDFEVDPTNRLVLRSGEVVPLTGKVFDLLLAFLENPGRLLDKEELIEKVWPADFVEEGNLARNVSTLRKALDSTDRDKYIATVQGRGYRFASQVERVGEKSIPDRPDKSVSEEKRQTRSRRSNSTYYWAAAASLCLLASALVGWRYFQPTVKALDIGSPRQNRLTTGGNAKKAAISADGRQAAYFERGSLKVIDIQTGVETRINPDDTTSNYIEVCFSPDGKQIFYSVKKKGGSPVGLYRQPLSGGEPQLVLEDIFGGVSFSPAGKIAFVRRYPELNEYALLTADADGSNVAKLASSRWPEHFNGTPAWSPDGSTIICPSINVESGFKFSISSVSAADGRARTIDSQRWTWLGSLAWIPDGRSIVLVGQGPEAVNSQIWKLDLASGAARQITDDTFVYDSLSASSDGKAIIAIKKRQESHVWLIGEAEKELTTGFDKYDGVGGIAWPSPGVIYFHSRASGKDAVWRMNTDRTAGEMLAADTGGGFAVSPHQTSLVYQGKIGDDLCLWQMDLKSGAASKLTANGTDMTPGFAPDGKSVVYAHYGDKLMLYRTNIDGTDVSKVFDDYRTIIAPSVSPSGRYIAFAFNQARSKSLQSGLAVIDSQSGKLAHSFDININLGNIYEHPTVQWSSDESSLYYISVENDVSNLWKLDIADGSRSPITAYKTGRIFNFATGPGLNEFALARGIVESDVVLID